MNFREIETLVDLVHVARISEVTVRSNGRRITIRKDPSRQFESVSPAPVEVIRSQVKIDEEDRQSVPSPRAAQKVVTAPMVGVFHAAEPPVRVGSGIVPGQVVGVIESMRLMNDVTAEVAGIATDVPVGDGMAVEYGQVILRIGAVEVDEGEDGV